MKILIRGARLALPDQDPVEGDLLIEDGRIARIGRDISDATEQVVEADGQLLMPGVIDPQVHFREPGKEHKEDLRTASHACARGGVTAFLEMPNTDPLTISQATLDDKLARAAQKCVVNYGFFLGATADNLKALQTVRGHCGIKIFMGSMHGQLLVEDSTILENIFAHTDPKMVIAVHAEDEARIRQRRMLFSDRFDVAAHSQIQDDVAALQATQRAVELAIKYRHRLHILHLSTGLEVEYLREHKPEWVSVEVTPQHLMLSTDDYVRLGSLAQMNPPLRSHRDQELLWQGLQDGTIDLIATDHAPHTLLEKAQPYPRSPSGMPGVETSLPLMLTAAQQQKCTLKQVVDWMCAAPAKAYRIQNKGRIQVGYDADLVLVDLERPRLVRREDLLTKCSWSPFEGWELVGWPTMTFVGGQIAFREGKVDASVRGKPIVYG